jgi:hypothetical protein
MQISLRDGNGSIYSARYNVVDVSVRPNTLYARQIRHCSCAFVGGAAITVHNAAFVSPPFIRIFQTLISLVRDPVQLCRGRSINGWTLANLFA